MARAVTKYLPICRLNVWVVAVLCCACWLFGNDITLRGQLIDTPVDPYITANDSINDLINTFTGYPVYIKQPKIINAKGYKVENGYKKYYLYVIKTFEVRVFEEPIPNKGMPIYLLAVSDLEYIPLNPVEIRSKATYLKGMVDRGDSLIRYYEREYLNSKRKRDSLWAIQRNVPPSDKKKMQLWDQTLTDYNNHLFYYNAYKTFKEYKNERNIFDFPLYFASEAFNNRLLKCNPISTPYGLPKITFTPEEIAVIQSESKRGSKKQAIALSRESRPAATPSYTSSSSTTEPVPFPTEEMEEPEDKAPVANPSPEANPKVDPEYKLMDSTSTPGTPAPVVRSKPRTPVTAPKARPRPQPRPKPTPRPVPVSSAPVDSVPPAPETKPIETNKPDAEKAAKPDSIATPPANEDGINTWPEAIDTPKPADKPTIDPSTDNRKPTPKPVEPELEEIDKEEEEEEHDDVQPTNTDPAVKPSTAGSDKDKIGKEKEKENEADSVEDEHLLDETHTMDEHQDEKEEEHHDDDKDHDDKDHEDDEPNEE